MRGVRRLSSAIDEELQAVKQTGARWVAHVNLRHFTKRRFTITIRITTADKRTLTGKRTYNVCGNR